MRIFWPQRSQAKGFSIRFASNYREELTSSSSKKNSNQSSSDNELKHTKIKSQNINETHLSIFRGHWANRDFSEYKEAA